MATPLTTDRQTRRKVVERIVCDDNLVAANTTCFAGGLTATNAAGALIPASDTAGITVQGRAARQMVNATGAAAGVTPRAQVEAGVFLFDNDGTHPCTAVDLGKSCYVVDDHTVGKVAATANSIIAGTVDAVETAGVWVRVNC